MRTNKRCSTQKQQIKSRHAHQHIHPIPMRLRIEVCPRPLHMYLRICVYSCSRPCRKHRIDVVFKSLWYESRHWLLRFIARMLRVEISVCFFHSHHSVTEWLTHTPKKKYYNPRKINLLSSMLKQSKLGLVCESVVPVDLYCRACRARCRGRLSNVKDASRHFQDENVSMGDLLISQTHTSTYWKAHVRAPHLRTWFPQDKIHVTPKQSKQYTTKHF